MTEPHQESNNPDPSYGLTVDHFFVENYLGFVQLACVVILLRHL
jgi:hypothetical protein